MKKIITIASLVAASLSYAASDVTINATLNVVDPATEVLINFDTTALSFGNVLIAPGTKESNTIKATLSGTALSNATLTFPTTVAIVNGANTITTNIEVPAVSAGGVASVVGTDNRVESSNPTAAPSYVADIKSTMTLNGNELAGLYTGTMNVLAKYE